MMSSDHESNNPISAPNPSNSSSFTLSSDQLMDYIKKQKTKIKTLENKLIKYEGISGNDKNITESKESSSTYLFWEFIHKQSTFHQNLARCALSIMFARIESSKLGQQHVPTVKNLFNKWKEKSIALKLSNFSSLEQKNVKLKALLARTHSINQKNIEDSNMLKQRQQDALNELKTLKERDGSERQV